MDASNMTPMLSPGLHQQAILHLDPHLTPPTPFETTVGAPKEALQTGTKGLAPVLKDPNPLLHRSALLSRKPGTLRSAPSSDETERSDGRSVSPFHGSNPRSNRAGR